MKVIKRMTARERIEALVDRYGAENIREIVVSSAEAAELGFYPGQPERRLAVPKAAELHVHYPSLPVSATVTYREVVVRRAGPFESTVGVVTESL